MLVSFLHFLANLLIAGTLLRVAQTKLADHPLGKALVFIY